MSGQISVAELEMKSTEELRSMLADDSLFELDNEAADEMIWAITSIIVQREKKDNVQTEAEKLVFWKRLIARSAGKVPVTMRDVLEHGESRDVTKPSPTVRIARMAAMVAAVVLTLFLGNTVSVHAFKYNILQAVADFSDDVFYKRYVGEENMQSSDLVDMVDGINVNNYQSLQEMLDDYGIWEIKEPAWMPDGYRFVSAQGDEQEDCNILIALFQNKDQYVVFNIIQYNETLDGKMRMFEKNKNTPSVYMYKGVEHYLFNNSDTTEASWVIGMNDCDIQGNVTLKEMEQMINSMYQED